MQRICPTTMFVHVRTPLRLLPLLGSMLLVATGCTSTHRVAQHAGGYSQVTEDVTGETVRVVLRDGQTMKLKNLYVGADSTRGTRPNGERRRVPTAALRKLTVVDHGTGIVQGAGIGLGTGLGTTLVATGTAEDDLGRAIAFVGGLLVSIPLTVVGGTVGGVIGQKEVYQFPERAPKSGWAAPPDRRTGTVRRREK